MSQYTKNIMPVIGSAETTQRDYLNHELTMIESVLRLPTVYGLRFQTLGAEPPKYQEGDLYYGAAGVFGGQEGLYIRDSNSWRKL